MRQPQQLSEDQADGVSTVARDLVRIENDLVNTRTVWLLQINGLLFAALGFAWGRAPDALVYVFGALGMGVSASAYSVLRLHHHALHDIYQWWEHWLTPAQLAPRRIVGLWRPSRARSIDAFLRPWNFLPRVFGYAWFAVVVTRMFTQA